MFRRTFIASLSSARECVPAGLEYEHRQDPESILAVTRGRLDGLASTHLS